MAKYLPSRTILFHTFSEEGHPIPVHRSTATVCIYDNEIYICIFYYLLTMHACSIASF